VAHSPIKKKWWKRRRNLPNELISSSITSVTPYILVE